jgi:uncharacterized phage protein gp47/JayE
MTVPNVADLLLTMSEDEVEQDQLDVIADAEFPVTSFGPTSVATTLVKADARTLKKVIDEVPSIVRGGFRKTATGLWLDLVADSEHDEARKPAVKTQRTLRITDAASVGPITLTARTHWARMLNGLRFVNITAPTIPLDGNANVTFEAEVAGPEYNDATSAWELVTPIPGTTIADPPGGLALTQQGTEAETDDEFNERLNEQWSTIGTGGNDDFYSYWAKTAHAEVKRVKVLAHTPGPGDVTVLIAGDSGALSGGVVTAVQADIAPRAPNIANVIVASVVNVTVVVTGTVYALASEAAAAQAAFETALGVAQRAMRIGGQVVRERIIEKIMAQLTDDDRNDVDLLLPAGDTSIAYNEVPVFDITGLDWEQV